MLLPMGQLTKVLVLLALVVPVTAYVAGALASPGVEPADHSPVILRDAPDEDDRRSSRSRDEGGDKARVVTPRPTPVGEDEDDWEDDGPDDDETDERDDDERDD
jgi:hypothetical protein